MQTILQACYGERLLEQEQLGDKADQIELVELDSERVTHKDLFFVISQDQKQHYNNEFNNKYNNNDNNNNNHNNYNDNNNNKNTINRNNNKQCK